MIIGLLFPDHTSQNDFLHIHLYFCCIPPWICSLHILRAKVQQIFGICKHLIKKVLTRSTFRLRVTGYHCISPGWRHTRLHSSL